MIWADNLAEARDIIHKLAVDGTSYRAHIVTEKKTKAPHYVIEVLS